MSKKNNMYIVYFFGILAFCKFCKFVHIFGACNNMSLYIAHCTLYIVIKKQIWNLKSKSLDSENVCSELNSNEEFSRLSQ